jgi:hypothetical protein
MSDVKRSTVHNVTREQFELYAAISSVKAQYNSIPYITQVVQNTVNDRLVSPRRGDVVIYGGYIFFHDGKALVKPDDGKYIPSIFKVPTEFPVDYWSDIHTHSCLHVLSFDTSLLPVKYIVEQFACNDNVEIDYIKIDTKSSPFYVFVARRSTFSGTTAGALEAFRKHGRCYRLSQLQFVLDELEEALKVSKFPSDIWNRSVCIIY